MPGAKTVLDALCAGDLSLTEAAAALAQGHAAGDSVLAQDELIIDGFVAQGRLALEAANRLKNALQLLGSVESVAPAPAVPDPRGTTSGGTGTLPATVGPGTVLRDRFILEEVVGVGGMGVVYRARDTRREEALDRNPHVAIKLLGEDFKHHPAALIALQREARRMQRLSHPHIATVYDFDRDGTQVYLVMELLEGEPLDQVLKQRGEGGLPRDEALRIIEAAGSALQLAHTRHIIHSDFKPANVFITRGGEIKVFDFGIARIHKDAAQGGESTRTVFDAAKLGAWTNAYASPEQLLDTAGADPRDDIYALGLVAYEVLTGKHPFGLKSSLAAQHLGLQPPQVPGLTAEQNALLASALSFSREQRPADALEFVHALTGAPVAPAAPPPARITVEEALAPPHRRIGRAVVAAIVLAGWLALFWAYMQSRGTP